MPATTRSLNSTASTLPLSSPLLSFRPTATFSSTTSITDLCHIRTTFSTLCFRETCQCPFHKVQVEFVKKKKKKRNTLPYNSISDMPTLPIYAERWVHLVNELVR